MGDGLEQDPDEVSWTEPIAVSPALFWVINGAIQFLIEKEGIYISTWSEVSSTSETALSAVQGTSVTDELVMQFWATTPDAITRFKEVLRGIGVSSLN